MRHGSLFSGIGGFDLAAEWMGWENIFHCEWNKFGQKVLKYYWPNAISYDDITKTDFTIHRGNIDILTGGFPCQPYSLAGKRLGKKDERHLWPEMLRAIREIAPSWIVGENVLGLVSWDGGLVFEEVQSDLEAEGYEVQPYVLPAASVNAPHKRDRVWFVAYCNDSRNASLRCRTDNDRKEKSEEWQFSFDEFNRQSNTRNASNPDSIRLEQREDRTKMGGGQKEMGRKRSEYTNATKTNGEVSNASDTDSHLLERSIPSYFNRQFSCKKEYDEECVSTYRRTIQFENFPTVSPICNGNDGISDRLDSITFPKWRQESIKAGGNAVVPQVVYQIFKTIEQYNNDHSI